MRAGAQICDKWRQPLKCIMTPTMPTHQPEVCGMGIADHMEVTVLQEQAAIFRILHRHICRYYRLIRNTMGPAVVTSTIQTALITSYLHIKQQKVFVPYHLPIHSGTLYGMVSVHFKFPRLVHDPHPRFNERRGVCYHSSS